MNSEPKTFYSNGKLLLTGEYVVLDGALSLAVPTKFGQSIKVEPISESKIIWKSYDEKGELWFEDVFSIKDLKSETQNHLNEISQRVVQILDVTKQLNPEFLQSGKGYVITTKLDFPKKWGLGTSSTLINNIADWVNVDAYKLLEKTFGGSGYDIACAQHDIPITYQLITKKPKVTEVNFNPPFKTHLYFLYLNKKQNSRDGIAHYKNNTSDISKEISKINDITLKMIDCDNLNDFQDLMDDHEQLISNIIKLKPIKELLFPDFQGAIKSLGAWGGDFVMVASKENPSDYFKSRGFETILNYSQLIK
ncbi:MAG: GYDIA family GHMP kinase [Gelidibacter sp.]